MAERIRARGEGGAGGWLESACKGILTFRAGILLITVVALWGQDGDGDKLVPAAAIIVAAVTTAIPLRYWDRVGPTLVRHPGYLAAELVLSTLILLLTGVNSPFFYYTLGSALLGGLVYGWPGAALFSAMLIGVYFWVVSVRDDSAASFVLPAFYPLIAAAGAGLRGLLDRQAETESELASQSERARLARDMHDSLAKTVSGMGFAALALARRIERDPAGAAEEARRLAEDARQATREAREIIIGLRSDAGEQLPLAAALQAEARRWSAGTGRPGRAGGRGGRRAAPGRRARARVDPARGARQRRPPRAGEQGDGAAAAARQPRGADRRRRRRRLRGARRARGARAGPPLRGHGHARAGAAGGRGPERRIGAGGGVRALGVDAGGRAGGRGAAAEAAAPTDTLPPPRSVPGYTWR